MQTSCAQGERFGVLIQNGGCGLADRVSRLLDDERLDALVEKAVVGEACRIALKPEVREAWSAEYDTAMIPGFFGLAPGLDEKDLEVEIMLALFGSPHEFVFSGIDEFAFSLRVRRNIVREARKTRLSFSAEEAERPDEYWDYSSERGFFIKSGRSLIDALRAATQPEVSGRVFSFSCYRATEYVLLLALALEFEKTDGLSLARLQEQFERSAIKSRRFHDVFLHEYGSMEQPVPTRFYVPGDRLWFRNPDPLSSDVCGYEGSWVYYLGSGEFSNFWKSDLAYTLESKSIEIFHWRHGIAVGENGEAMIDESEVERKVRDTESDARRRREVLEYMLRYRDRSGEYCGGGCVDTTREYPRYIRSDVGDFLAVA